MPNSQNMFLAKVFLFTKQATGKQEASEETLNIDKLLNVISKIH